MHSKILLFLIALWVWAQIYLRLPIALCDEVGL